MIELNRENNKISQALPRQGLAFDQTHPYPPLSMLPSQNMARTSLSSSHPRSPPTFRWHRPNVWGGFTPKYT